MSTTSAITAPLVTRSPTATSTRSTTPANGAWITARSRLRLASWRLTSACSSPDEARANARRASVGAVPLATESGSISVR